MSASQKRHPPVLTIAALYGVADSVISPLVAKRLGMPLFDREIPEAAAKKTGLSEEAVDDVDEEPRSAINRLVASLGRAATVSGSGGDSAERPDLQEREIRSHVGNSWRARASWAGWRSGAAGWSCCTRCRGHCTSN